MSIGMFAAITFVPFFMQGIIGMSASESGTIMMPMMVAMIMSSIIGGQLVFKIGIKAQIITGMAIISFAYFLLSTLEADTSKLTATTYVAIIGFGIALLCPLLLWHFKRVSLKKRSAWLLRQANFSALSEVRLELRFWEQ